MTVTVSGAELGAPGAAGSSTNPLSWGRGPARPSRVGPTGTGQRTPGHRSGQEVDRVREEGPAHPRAWGPKGISPRSTPRRAASSTGRKTFILEETGVLSAVSRSQRNWPCLERCLVGGRGLPASRLSPSSGAGATRPGAGCTAPPPMYMWQVGLPAPSSSASTQRLVRFHS